MASLDERLDSFAEPWKPAPGDRLVGEVTDLSERENEYGSYPIVTVRTNSGDEFAFHAFRTVAKNELAKARPQVGDKIGIAYHGKPAGKDYELYRVIVERDDQPTMDWDKHAAADDVPEDAGPSDDSLGFSDDTPF
jgi:hypothetical protein